MLHLVTPHWSCGEAPVSVVPSFSKRRQLSTRGMHWLVKAVKIAFFPPTWYPKPSPQAGTLFKIQSSFSLGSPDSACCGACCCSLTGPLTLYFLCTAETPPATNFVGKLLLKPLFTICELHVSCNGCPGCNRKICCLVFSTRVGLLTWQFLVSVLIFSLL